MSPLPLMELAAKSIVVAAVALGLLQLLGRRSAAERSWVAHAALAVLAILPVAAMLLPRWRLLPARDSVAPVAATPTAASVEAAPIDPAALMGILYMGGALLLLLGTLVAIARLYGLRHRAAVLVEEAWVTALARAQQRMRVKSGAALLVSEAVASPVSWGMVRPTIVINRDLVAATQDAEAVIAHELAHLVRLDWAKLIAARLVTAVFWFNPLVWMLARQCHQLREEAADDAVLGAGAPRADYATLLVEAARLQGGRPAMTAVHGVAPGEGSLHRRVARVLDAAARRTPTPVTWAVGVAMGAALFTGPLAALTLERAEAAPAAAVTVTGVKGVPFEPAVATAEPARPAAVTVAQAPRGTSPAAGMAAAERLTTTAPAEPAAPTTSGPRLGKGTLTLASVAAAPSLVINKPAPPRATVTAAAPATPKVAIAAPGPRMTLAPGKVRLGAGLTLAADDARAPRPNVTVNATASSSSSHSTTINGKTVRVENVRNNDSRADERADERDRLQDEADRRRDQQAALRDAQRDAHDRVREVQEAERELRQAQIQVEAAQQRAAAAAARLNERRAATPWIRPTPD